MAEETNINHEMDKELTDQDSIGSLLKTARINRAEELGEVSSKLRIRQVYLEALEANQFTSLPGDIYVIGFIRSYATYLGLKSEEIVESYKSEIVRLNVKTELKFPTYVAENGIPGGAILLLGLIIAIIGYGSWYFLSVRDTFDTDQVTSIPKPLESLVDGKPSNRNSDKEERIAKNPVTTVINNSGSPKIKPENNENETKTQINELQTKLENNENETLEKKVLGEKKLEQEPPDLKTDRSPKIEPDPDPIIYGTPKTKTELNTTSDVKIESNLSTNNKIKRENPALEPKEKNTAAKLQQDTLVETKTPTLESSRIVLEALTDSYIQVRDNDAKRLLVTRLLKKGQRYQVPDRPGLTLITGNAGALKILVDGGVVPSIGPIGAIRRNVMLDAIKLINGLAVIE